MRRGRLLENARFDEIKGVEDEINRMLLKDADRFQVPIYAFVIFTNQEAYERCQNYLQAEINGSINSEKVPFQILGEPAVFQEATEPTNIIWENLEVSKAECRRRKSIAYLVIAIFICLVFLLFTFLKSASAKNKMKYPPTTDCAGIQRMFADPFGVVDASKFSMFAELDQAATFNQTGLGYYQCFCQ